MSNNINERENKSLDIGINTTKKESYKKLKSLLNKSINNISQSMSYYIIKFFVDKKIHSTSLKDLLNNIINIFNKNPESIVTNTDEEFTSKRGIKVTFTKLINKNLIINYKSNSNICKLNEIEAINYLKSYKIHYRKNKNDCRTPIKLSSKSEKLLPLEEK
jgi:hypothetical protein